jgi:hypothetical protein
VSGRLAFFTFNLEKTRTPMGRVPCFFFSYQRTEQTLSNEIVDDRHALSWTCGTPPYQRGKRLGAQSLTSTTRYPGHTSVHSLSEQLGFPPPQAFAGHREGSGFEERDLPGVASRLSEHFSVRIGAGKEVLVYSTCILARFLGVSWRSTKAGFQCSAILGNLGACPFV